MYATWYRTAYMPESVKFILDPEALRRDGWGPWHELGHMRQQPAWTWDGMGEVTVNVFSRAVQRKFGLPSRFDQDGLWTKVREYLARPDATRKYDAEEDPFLKLGMLEQLQLAFGDSLFHKLQQTVRKNPDEPGDNGHRRDFFAVETSRISGRDLRPFFAKWGLEISSAARTRIGEMALPLPEQDLSSIER